MNWFREVNYVLNFKSVNPSARFKISYNWLKKSLYFHIKDSSLKSTNCSRITSKFEFYKGLAHPGRRFSFFPLL